VTNLHQFLLVGQILAARSIQHELMAVAGLLSAFLCCHRRPTHQA
jgi:hypothetical protein